MVSRGVAISGCISLFIWMFVGQWRFDFGILVDKLQLYVACTANMRVLVKIIHLCKKTLGSIGARLNDKAESVNNCDNKPTTLEQPVNKPPLEQSANYY